jgi:hypothetical protein
MGKHMWILPKMTTHLLLTVLLLMSCNSSSKKNVDNNQIDKGFGNSLTEKQIGKSNFYISLPTDYAIKTHNGPDFSVYYFSPKDTSVKPSFSGGIYFGNFPHEFEPKNDSCKTSTVKGVILHSSQDWTVYNCNEDFTVQTIVESKSGEGWNERIHVFGTAVSREEMQKLLDIYVTLKLEKK